MRPVIGVTSAWSYETWGDCEPYKGYYYVGKPYVEAIYESLGIPIIIPPHFRKQDLDELMELIDGVVFSGGGNARVFKTEELPELREQQESRYEFEKGLMERAYKMEMPILGICRGYQMMVEVFGGSLSPEVIKGHKDREHSNRPHHSIFIEKDSKLHEIINEDEWGVNSIHSQQVDKIPEGFIISAKSKDKVIEGIEAVDYPFLMGLQFHPELLQDDEKAKEIFEYFIDEVKKYVKKKPSLAY